MKIAGAIIAGGRSSRMGGVEKIFLEIGGKPILDRIVSRLAPHVDRLVINANGDASRFAQSGLAVLPDLRTNIATPLAGLHASLHWAARNGFDRLLTVPADTPFLPRDLMQKLSTGSHDAVIAASGGQKHFLTGLWATSLLPVLESAITAKALVRVKDWATEADAATVEWPVSLFDPFFNVNTPEDLAEAAHIAAEFDP